MSLLEIRQLQEDMADLRKEFISTCKRNKELEGHNDQLRKKLSLTEHWYNNLLKAHGKSHMVKGTIVL